MAQPEGYVKQGQEHLVCKLKKALYGLKQAPRAWYAKLDEYLCENGFSRCSSDSSLYVKGTNEAVTILVVYVDDMILTGNDVESVSDIKHQLERKFEMTDLGLLNYYLGIQVEQQDTAFTLCQTKYIKDLLAKFRMEECNPCSTPMEVNCNMIPDEEEPHINVTLYRQLVGSLIYLTATRPDIAYSVGLISRYMHEPRQRHWQAAKKILRYLKGTTELKLTYPKENTIQLIGYCDSDWAGDKEQRKSTSGHCFFLGSAPISWSSKKQATVALSSTEAEYKSAVSATTEAVWLRQLLQDLNLSQQEATILHCDNQSAIKIAKNPVLHARTKHIEVHQHFIREKIQNKEINLVYCPTSDQVADILTKPLGKDKFQILRDKIGLTG